MRVRVVGHPGLIAHQSLLFIRQACMPVLLVGLSYARASLQKDSHSVPHIKPSLASAHTLHASLLEHLCQAQANVKVGLVGSCVFL